VNTTRKKVRYGAFDSKRCFNVPVHMHERLSASTDLRPVRPEVANDKRGPGSARAGIIEDRGEGENLLFFRDSSREGVEWESLRWTPSTNARNLSSGGEGKSPLWEDGSTGAAVGRDKVEETDCGVIAVFIDSPSLVVVEVVVWLGGGGDRGCEGQISDEGLTTVARQLIRVLIRSFLANEQ
jgi:hypothetical protein